MSKTVVFWSSVEGAAFMTSIIDAIRAEGIDVSQRFFISSESYRNSSTVWGRIILRIQMYILYPISLIWACLVERKPRIYVVTTNTFFAPLIATLFSGKNQIVIHLVWDLFPDALLVGKNKSTNKHIIKLIEIIVKKTLNRATANVFLGQRLLKHAESRFINIPNPYVIPVGASVEVFADSPPQNINNNIPIDLLYCGNLGAMHDTATLYETLKKNKEFKLTITFNANGIEFFSLKNKLSLIDTEMTSKIKMQSMLNNTEWVKRMKSAHVALVTMKSGSEKVVMPSKTYSALAAGQAILAICPENSDLAQLVKEENCGWVVSPGDVEMLLNVFNEMTNNHDALHTMRENSFRVAHSKYSTNSIAKEWVKLFNTING